MVATLFYLFLVAVSPLRFSIGWFFIALFCDMIFAHPSEQ